MVIQCPECLSKYGGPYNHSHTGGTLFDIRFFDCPTCHGVGAITCERCQGVGRIEKTTGEPARGVNEIILQRTADRARKIAKP